MKSIMVDNETLGVDADACIISIGAVKFDLAAGKIDDEGFYVSISIASNLAAGRQISEETLKWWMKQPAAAQQVFHEPKIALPDALDALRTWIGKEEAEIWSNGAVFDIPMLQHAYAQLGEHTPWKFWNARCYRTYKTLPGASNVKLPAAGVKHNALSDAVAQAEGAIAIYKALFGKKVKA